MNGNTPYAGAPDVSDVSLDDLTADQKRALRDNVADIATLTREFLPDEYVVGSKVTANATGPQATVSVQPPVGRPVSAGFEPDAGDLDGEDALIGADERDEVARGLAASAALQVKQAMQNKITPTAR
ncbi:hypothetical protein DMJ13_02880 [halophilic archaeon]|nr:hypothetical protein DMJ13_02880 [halophilic archaeon]